MNVVVFITSRKDAPTLARARRRFANTWSAWAESRDDSSGWPARWEADADREPESVPPMNLSRGVS